MYSKILSALFLILFGLTVLNAQLYTDSEELSDAVNASSNGGVFTVKNGNYHDFEASFEVKATEDKPIYIKAETIGGVTLTGESQFVFKKSSHVILEGFVFDAEGEETLVKLEGCDHIRITRNVFELKTTESIKWVFVGGFWSDNTWPFNYPSHHNRIDHNIFKNKDTPGHYITIDGSFEENGGNEIYHQSQYDRIDHNYFMNNGPRAVNEQESIRIGWSEMSLSSGFTTVEFNLFEDCDGDPEIISVKSSDNAIKHNTFVGSYGTLSLRHGNRNHVEGNYFFGNNKEIGTSPNGATLYTGGIRIYGTDHLIINNYMEGLTGTVWDAPIALTQGDAIDGESSNLSKHFRAERVTIAYNTLVNNINGIEIGFDNNNNYNKDLKDIKIYNNLITGSENSLVRIMEPANDQGDNITWSNNLMHPLNGASILEGASITSFDNSEITNENPFLEFDDNVNIWRATSETPLYELSSTSETTSQDIEGQSRPIPSNPGADQFSLEMIRFAPLTPDDVGPDAPEGITTSVENIEEFQINIYPNPSNSHIIITFSELEVSKIEILDISGKLVALKEDVVSGNPIGVSNLSNGIYFMRIYNANSLLTTKKIIVKQ